MDLDEIDDTLRRLQAAADAIGANLLELERDPNRKLLETATLSGETATQWADATRALANVWQWFTRFTEVLERATAVRGTRGRVSADRQSELVVLLTGPSIALHHGESPLSQRDLLSDGQLTTQCTPDELLTLMSEQFDQALRVVVAISATWGPLADRVGEARSALAEIAAALTELGEPHDADLERLQRQLDRLGNAVATDPITVEGGDFDTLETELERLRRTLDAAMQLREEVVERVAQARSTANKLRSAAWAAAEAHREVLLKIASPAVPAPSAVDRAIGDELDHVIGLTEQGQWRAAQHALDAWSACADELLRRAHECAAANRAPIEARDELRGRLDAYQAMAHRIGMLEDPDAAQRYERAHDVLYTAPTDLVEAADLVRRYQDTLSMRQPDRKEAR